MDCINSIPMPTAWEIVMQWAKFLAPFAAVIASVAVIIGAGYTVWLSRKLAG